jgi:hypothetical protein
MGTPLNPPNVRYPFTLPDDTHSEVRKALEYTFNGLTVHEQAFAAIKSQLDKVVSKASTVTNTFSGGGGTPGPPTITSLGVVNDQLGVTSYTTQQGDNGAKIIVGDALPVTVILSSAVTIPWFCIIDNDSSAVANLSPSTGSLYGEDSIPPFGFGIIFFDGTNFWSGATKIATDSSLGYVQPDNVTIGIDSGMIYTQIFADSGAPGFTPITPGNPFYFRTDSTPWGGYIWDNGAWNAFGGGSGGGGGTGNVVGPASAVDSDFAQFDGTTGKLIKDGGLSLTTDGTLAADSDSLIPSEKAVKTYVDARSIVPFGVTFDGGASVPTAPIVRYIEVPFDCTITSWTITGDASGSASVDVWFIAGSGAPPTAPNIPTSSNKISASAPIALSSAQSAAGGASAISTWTPALTKWGQLAFNLSSVTTCKSINVQIQCTKT